MVAISIDKHFFTAAMRPALVLAVIAVVLSACSDTDDAPEPAANAVATDYWQRLNAAVQLMRTSPDHLPAERDRIVAAGDIDAAVEFVRRAFRVMPDSIDGFMNAASGRRWGAAGALRAGMGTPRDLADLLREMLIDMGHDDAIVIAKRHGTLRDPLSYEPPEFAPAREPDSLGPPIGPRPPEPVAIRAADTESVAAPVLEAIPTGSIAPRTVADLPTVLPTVQFRSEGGFAVADLWGTTGGTEIVEQAGREAGARDIASVTVRLKTLGFGERQPVTVAELTTGLDRLLGRQIHARFAPSVDSPLELLRRPAADFDVFLPTLFVPGAEDLVATGMPIDIAGGRLEATDGGIRFGRGDVVAGADANAIAGIEIVRVDTGRFPHVEITARLTDTAGEAIAGVAASAFTVEEEGDARSARLLSNTAPPPRILFLVDGSRSVPDQYRGAGAGTVVRSVAEGILAQLPDAQFRVTVEQHGTAAARTDWTDELADLDAAARMNTQSSLLWEAYADASERFAPDVIVMTTDGVSERPDSSELRETPPPEFETRLRSAAPAVMLGSGDLGAAFAGIAERTGGVALSIDDQAADIAAAVEQALAAAGGATHRIRYRADRSGPAERTVTLSANDVSASATFTVPAEANAVYGRHLAGLYLEIEYPAGARPVQRRLAGVDLASVPAGGIVTLDRVIAEDVRVALFGKWALSIDGGSPSPSQLLEQRFVHRLSMRGLFEAATVGDFAEAMGSVQPMSDHAQLFSLPLVGAQAHRVFEQGVRMWLETDRRTVTSSGEFAVSAVDLLPFTRFDAHIAEPGEALAATAAASATLALAERHAFEQSALAELEHAASLGYDNVADGALSRRLQRVYPGFVFAANDAGEQTAAWAIDRRSGSLIPVLHDGTGGGLTVGQVESRWRMIDKGLELAGIVDGVPTSITLWAQLERVKIAKLANSTIAILTMGTDDFSPPEDTDFGDVECEVIQTAVDNVAGGVVNGTAAGRILTVIGKLNDWGEFTGFGGTGIPTSLPVCP